MDRFILKFVRWLKEQMEETIDGNGRMELCGLEIDRVEEFALIGSGYVLLEGEGVRYKISIETVFADEFPFEDERE